jgi:hypothetical protein
MNAMKRSAFPVNQQGYIIEPGMTIRQYFAIEIFKELMKNGDTDFNEDCEEAYRLADKLIKAGDA